MQTIQFGLAVQYDSGRSNDVDTNGKIAVEVHNSQASASMWYHIGQVNEATINWGASHKYSDGYHPSIAINNHQTIVEVHETSNALPWNHKLYYKVGQVNGTTIDWGGDDDYDSGVQPSVAINDFGDVVEVHKSQTYNTLWYRVGKINGKSIEWSASHEYDKGVTPTVTINNHGQIIAVHKSQSHDKLWYRVGTLAGSKIEWGPSRQYQDGANPSIAITNEGTLVEVHQSQGLTGLWQLSGEVHGTEIQWSTSFNYDSGSKPRCGISSDGQLAIQVHEGSMFGMWFSTSRLMNPSKFMENLLPITKELPLRKMTFPATHDTGMYTQGLSTLAKTQDQNLYGQLSGGARYFDLRPNENLDIYHGPITGPSLQSVLDDIKRFYQEGHRELAILKFSHFDNFDAAIYEKMKTLIKSTLGPWLYTQKPANKQRLADITMGEFLANSGKILVVVDGDWALNQKEAGFWVYRDWQSSTAEKGDLTVFDIYSNTVSFDTMKQDQLKKLALFNGLCCAKQKDNSWQCQTFSKVPCDLFLLSWTLTPPTGVWFAAKEANRHLGEVMAGQEPNAQGYFANLLYLDYFEFARPAFISELLIKRYNHLISEAKKQITTAV